MLFRQSEKKITFLRDNKSGNQVNFFLSFYSVFVFSYSLFSVLSLVSHSSFPLLVLRLSSLFCFTVLVLRLGYLFSFPISGPCLRSPTWLPMFVSILVPCFHPLLSFPENFPYLGYPSWLPILAPYLGSPSWFPAFLP